MYTYILLCSSLCLCVGSLWLTFTIESFMYTYILLCSSLCLCVGSLWLTFTIESFMYTNHLCIYIYILLCSSFAFVLVHYGSLLLSNHLFIVGI